MNQTGDSPEAQEQAQLAEWNKIYNEIKDGERGDRTPEEQDEARIKRPELFKLSTPEQKSQLLKEAVQSFGETEGTEISAVIERAFGYIPEDLSDIQETMEAIIDGKQIIEDSEGPVGGNYILE
ncbi:hypothetical protein C4544_05620 [candidate division WS5 bacterium]|uniref:Uncharacterized protein n=1 Tax=candidate division WS5 bacterium TaxID=2093353 RepID=A0A419DAS1_9BACT|nr:MAG: hypothetical protein C4544_05620 [candidate division WS5 bacterium]